MATKKSQAASESPSYVTTGLEGEVTTAKTAKDADTFHKMVIQEGMEFSGGDPANQPVIVSADVIEDFQYPRTTRPARRLVAAAGTMTTRRLAEEGGIKGVADWSPEGDEADNPRPQFSTPISTAEANTASADDGDADDDDADTDADSGPRKAGGTKKAGAK